ncbi:MAG: CDP-alcohol phosphatidyltransferase family protein [archaeon]|nr:CDP-alcohol phosphatidyltransferase family protein [archaeon]
MGRIPDALSLSRLILGPTVLFLDPSDVLFYGVYAFCALTDVVDGYLSRRYGTCTRHGEVLDSIADAVLILSVVISLLMKLDWEPWMLEWIAGIGVIRLVSLSYGTGRFGKIAVIHTYANKVAGLFAYGGVFLIPFVDLPLLITVICSVTTVSAVEYLLINVLSKDLDSERRSLMDLF